MNELAAWERRPWLAEHCHVARMTDTAYAFVVTSCSERNVQCKTTENFWKISRGGGGGPPTTESQRLSLNKAKWWKTERHWLMQTFRAKVSCNEMTSLTRTAVVTFIVGCWLPHLQRMCFTHNVRVTYDQGRRQGRSKEIYPPPKKKNCRNVIFIMLHNFISKP